MQTKFAILTMFLAVLLFSACTTANQRGRVGQSQAYHVYYGKITSIHEVDLDNSTEQTLGSVIGGATGAVLGNAIGGGSGRTIATVIGGAAGLLAGAYTCKQINGKAFEIIIETDQGQTLSVVESPSSELVVGQKVKVMLGNNFSRVEPI